METNKVNRERLIPKNEELEEITLDTTRDYNSTGSSDKSVCSMCIDDFDNKKDYYECTVCKNKMHKECLIKYVTFHKIKGNIMECYICNRGMFNFSNIYPIIPSENPEFIISQENNSSDDNDDLNFFVRPIPRINFSLRNYLQALSSLFVIIMMLSLILLLTKLFSE